MLRRENGVKYLDIDGANCVVHMCSTAENYFDRFAFDDQPTEDLLADFVEKATFSGVRLPGKDVQECCFCGDISKIYPLLPNNYETLCCLSCRRNMSVYVIQLNRELEKILGLEGPTSGLGTSTIWLSVPAKHPEFLHLINRTGYSNGARIRCYEYEGAAPWWRYYHQLLNTINKKA